MNTTTRQFVPKKSRAAKGDGGSPPSTYRIKSAAETFERTADESELTLP
jgi:hypothetical protein